MANKRTRSGLSKGLSMGISLEHQQAPVANQLAVTSQSVYGGVLGVDEALY